MDKDTFLRLQYVRMMNSEEFVVERWRSSVGRFLADMWARTPAKPGRRFLSPVVPSLGFSPDNVEWQFPKIKAKQLSTKKARMVEAKSSPEVEKRPTKAERKANERAHTLAVREKKRQVIAQELAAWNNGQLAVKSG